MPHKSKKEIKTRILTGVLGSGLLLCLVILGKEFGILVFTGVLSLVMVYEFSEMVFSLPDQEEKKNILLVNALLVLIGYHFFNVSQYMLLLFVFTELFLYFLVTAKNRNERDQAQHFKDLTAALFGCIYLMFMPLELLKMYHLRSGSHWVCLFFWIVFSGDTAAYFIGKKFGKTKIYPEISPNKTLEGALGGLMMSVLSSVLFCSFLFPSRLVCRSEGSMIFLGLMVGLMAQVGDFCESFLKRAFHKKDAGFILPGHGGFLDRFDGVLFSLPVMNVLIQVLK